MTWHTRLRRGKFRAVSRGGMVLLGVLAALSDCGRRSLSTPQGTAEVFLDRYFIEYNQESALELSDGLAAQKLRSEIELVRDARAGVAPEEFEQMKPHIEYALERESAAGEDRTNLVFDLTIRPVEGDNYHRKVLVTVARRDEAWRVVNYQDLE